MKLHLPCGLRRALALLTLAALTTPAWSADPAPYVNADESDEMISGAYSTITIGDGDENPAVSTAKGNVMADSVTIMGDGRLDINSWTYALTVGGSITVESGGALEADGNVTAKSLTVYDGAKVHVAYLTTGALSGKVTIGGDGYVYILSDVAGSLYDANNWQLAIGNSYADYEVALQNSTYTVKDVDLDDSNQFNIYKGNITLHDEKMDYLCIGEAGDSSVTAASDITTNELWVGNTSNMGSHEAALDMNGHALTVKGSLHVYNGGSLHGSGSLNNLTLKNGGHLYVGNSPGYQTWTGTTTIESGSTITFCIDGTTPATAANSGSGTYSNVLVSSGSLTLGSNINICLEVGEGILGVGEFTLPLFTVDSAVTVNGDMETAFNYTITDGEENLASDAVVEYKDGVVTLRATAEGAAPAAPQYTPNGHALVNTLWSSTSAVRSFARVATTQTGTPAVPTGDYSVWSSALSDFVSMSGFSSSAFGYAVGADKQFCPHVRTGIAFGQMFGDYSADRGVAEVEQRSIMVGLYSEYVRELDKVNSVSLTSYAAYGQTDNDADTRVDGELPGRASWDDDVFSLGTRAAWNVRVTSDTTLSPFIGLEYLHGSQDSFTEHFGEGSHDYRDGSMQVWSLPVGITARTKVELGAGQTLLPELTLACVGDIARKNPHVRTAQGCEEGTKPGRSAFLLNAGAHWLFNESWSAAFFYNLETRSHEVSQEASLSVQYSF